MKQALYQTVLGQVRKEADYQIKGNPYPSTGGEASLRTEASLGLPFLKVNFDVRDRATGYLFSLSEEEMVKLIVPNLALITMFLSRHGRFYMITLNFSANLKGMHYHQLVSLESKSTPLFYFNDLNH